MELIKCPQTDERHSYTHGPQPNLGSTPGVSWKGISELSGVPGTSRCNGRTRGPTKLLTPVPIPHPERSLLRMWTNGPLCPKLPEEKKTGEHQPPGLR